MSLVQSKKLQLHAVNINVVATASWIC